MAQPLSHRVINWLHRLALCAAYPVLLRLENVFGIRSKVAVVAVWHEDQLLLVRHSYRRYESLPGGTIGRDETPADAAVSELHEEVGIAARPSEIAPLCSYEHRKWTTWLFKYRPDPKPQIVPDHREVNSARFVAPAQIPV